MSSKLSLGMTFTYFLIDEGVFTFLTFFQLKFPKNKFVNLTSMLQAGTQSDL